MISPWCVCHIFLDLWNSFAYLVWEWSEMSCLPPVSFRGLRTELIFYCFLLLSHLPCSPLPTHILFLGLCFLQYIKRPMKTCPRWCCSLSWSLATLCFYLKEQTKTKTKRHMLLVCNPAGSGFSYSCLCCSHSWFLLFLLPHSAPIAAFPVVYSYYKIPYILSFSLTVSYILFFLSVMVDI